VDEFGMLRRPRERGRRPGPACYGLGSDGRR
jgi:hypothetical protein